MQACSRVYDGYADAARPHCCLAAAALSAVLSNPQLRIVYDLYGADGLEAGSEIAPYFETRAEIKAEFEARLRYHEQQKARAAADPKGHSLEHACARLSMVQLPFAAKGASSSRPQRSTARPYPEPFSKWRQNLDLRCV